MSNNKTVKRYPLSKQVSDKLEQMIAKGEYPVGSRIPTEVELMEIFKVSRNTIREAIQSLNSAGVLDVRQGDGTYVKSSNRFDANMNLKYEQVSLEDIREVRNSLEITIASLAARRRTEKELEVIREKFISRKESHETIKENTLADVEFHMAIAEACHNTILIDLYHSISSYLIDHIAERQAVTELDWDEIDRLHEELYIAIRDHKPDIANICAHNILNI